MDLHHLNKGKIKKIILIYLISFFKNISSEITCERDKPILVSNVCSLTYCSDDKFNSGECKITNPQIKTQWINNFVRFGGAAYRFLTISTFSTGDMIVQSTSNPKSGTRVFYGLKQNGRPYFTNKTTDKETPFYSITTEA